MLYPNFDTQHSFSTNHLEKGIHHNADDPKVKFVDGWYNVPLFKGDESFLNQWIPSTPTLFDRLAVLDLFWNPSSLYNLTSAASGWGGDFMCADGTRAHISDTGFPDCSLSR